MRKNVGLALVAATLMMTARFSNGPAPSTTPAPNTSAPRSASSAHRGQHPTVDVKPAQSRCTAYLPSIDDQHPTDDARGAAYDHLARFIDRTPESANKDKAADNDQYHLSKGVRAVIALVPDPKHTNLALFFDREMSAIQQAAQDDGYSFESSWMPWKVSDRAYPLLEDDLSRSALDDSRETCPGILTFRKDPGFPNGPTKTELAEQLFGNGLIVLTVGEQPTGGINDDQWNTAVDWISEHARNEDGVLRVLGPTFSGSLVSLNRALNDKRTTLFARVQVLSGTVSSCRLWHWFTKNKGQNIDFASFQENDVTEIHRFVDFLATSGWKPQDVAVVSEDETSYARIPTEDNLSTPDDACFSSFLKPPNDPKPSNDPDEKDTPVFLSYPRDISALRDAYQKQAVGENESAQSPHLVLRENSEAMQPVEETDSVTTYSGESNVLSQEAQLYAIVSFLRTHHTHYVILRSTNPLDSIFLARFFHRAYPLARVVTVGSDLLFARDLASTDFRGMLALSSFPLLPILEWKPHNSDYLHTHRIFESHHAEGEYMASRVSFERTKDKKKEDDPPALTNTETPSSVADAKSISQTDFYVKVTRPLPNFAPPNWIGLPKQDGSSVRNPTWISVLGRDGYWPVSVLTEQNSRSCEPKCAAQGPAPTSVRYQSASQTGEELKDSSDSKGPKDPKTPEIPLSFKVAKGLAFLLLIYEAFGLVGGSKIASLGLFAPFHRFTAFSHLFLLAQNAAISVSISLLFVLLPFGAKSSTLPFFLNWRFWIAVIVFALLLLVATKFERLRHWRTTAVSVFLATLGVIMAASLFAFNVEQLVRFGSDQYAFYDRCFHVVSGVSHLLPILFLLVGFYIWNWQMLAGNRLLLPGRPILPSASHLREQTRLSIGSDVGWRILNVAKPLALKWPIVAVLAIVGSVMILYFSNDLPLLVFENFRYSTVIDLALLFSLLLTTAESMRLFLTWYELRNLLAALQNLKLRRTFSRLRIIDSSSLWNMSGSVLRIQERFLALQIDVARRLLLLYPDSLPLVANAVKEYEGNSLQDKRPNICSSLADATAEVLNKLNDTWTSETDSLNLKTDEPETQKTEESGATPTALPLSDHLAVQTKEEFVAFQYVAFIQNILGRMRTMILAMIFLFVFSCFSISFYPFAPRNQVSMWMMINFALIGGGVIYVYARMERDEILSFITNTPPGHLTLEFWLKSAAFLAGPIIGLLTTQFPQIADAVLGSLGPSLEALRN